MRTLLVRLILSTGAATLLLLGGWACDECTVSDVRIVGHVALDVSHSVKLNAFLDPECEKFLLRYLSSDPEWKVYDCDAIVADGRGAVISKINRKDGNAHLEIRVRFGSYGACMSPWLADALREGAVAIVKIRDQRADVRMPLWKSEDASGHFGSYLMVGGDGLWIEIKEWSTSRDRACTRRALEYIVTELSRIAALSRDRDDAEYWQEALPADSLGEKQAVTVLYNHRRDNTEYTIAGHVNQGSEGRLRLRAFDAGTGKEIQLTPIEECTRYVGWSKESQVFFPFRFDVRVWDDMVSGKGLRLEVSFTPKETEKVILVK